MPQYILAHDMGTTNHKCTVFNEKGEVTVSAAKTYATFYEKGGFAEQDPDVWWDNFRQTTRQVLDKVSPARIAAVSFSAHMNGCLPVDQNGRPLMKSMIHADTRSCEIADEIYHAISEDELYTITGNRIDSRYPLLKMYWLKEKRPEIYNSAAFFLQAKDYLAYRLTGTLGITDFSDASLTGAFNLKKRSWEVPIFKETGLQVSKMPVPIASTEVVGYVQKSAAAETGLLEGTPVVIGGGDGACATIGAGCLNKGQTYISLGTTAWVSKVVEEPFMDREKRVFTICDLNPKFYNVLGTMQSAGSAYDWAIRQFSSIVDWETMRIDPQFNQFEHHLRKIPAGSRGLIFHPYLLGERSPIWNDKARGSFFGISLDHNRFDFAKAVLEGIAFSLTSISEIINGSDTLKEIRMIGGLVKSDSLIQMISDAVNVPIQLTKNASEATSIGAAIAAGVGIQMFSSFEEAAGLIKTGNAFTPISEHHDTYKEILVRFKLLYDRIKDISFNQ